MQISLPVMPAESRDTRHSLCLPGWSAPPGRHGGVVISTTDKSATAAGVGAATEAAAASTRATAAATAGATAAKGTGGPAAPPAPLLLRLPPLSHQLQYTGGAAYCSGPPPLTRASLLLFLPLLLQLPQLLLRRPHQLPGGRPRIPAKEWMVGGHHC